MAQDDFLIMLPTHVGELGALFHTVCTQGHGLAEPLGPVSSPTTGQEEEGVRNQAALLKVLPIFHWTRRAN